MFSTVAPNKFVDVALNCELISLFFFFLPEITRGNPGFQFNAHLFNFRNKHNVVATCRHATIVRNSDEASIEKRTQVQIGRLTTCPFQSHRRAFSSVCSWNGHVSTAITFLACNLYSSLILRRPRSFAVSFASLGSPLNFG